MEHVWRQRRYLEKKATADASSWPIALHLLEDDYTAADAVVVGGLLICLPNHADVVRAASLAQLVNMIAPIRTEPKGPAWRQTIFHPFALTSRLARNTVLRTAIQSQTLYTQSYGDVLAVDAAAAQDPASGNMALFLTNRDPGNAAETTITLPKDTPTGYFSARTIHDRDPQTRNSAQYPSLVVPQPNSTLSQTGNTITITLPPVSWTVMQKSERTLCPDRWNKAPAGRYVTPPPSPKATTPSE